MGCVAVKKAKPKKSPAKAPPKRRPGRPSAYRAEYAEQAFKLCLLGATDKDIADFFGVSEQTVNAWKQSQPDFLESLKRGKDSADAEVAHRLYQRALGYEHKAVKIMQYEGVPVIVPYTERYAPDTAAGIFWLKNRKKVSWRDRIDHANDPDNPLIGMAIVVPKKDVATAGSAVAPESPAD